MKRLLMLAGCLMWLPALGVDTVTLTDVNGKITAEIEWVASFTSRFV
jgi:hypothetical protein